MCSCSQYIALLPLVSIVLQKSPVVKVLLRIDQDIEEYLVPFPPPPMHSAPPSLGNPGLQTILFYEKHSLYPYDICKFLQLLFSGTEKPSTVQIS